MRIGESVSMFFAFSVASMRSDSGCMCRPLVTGVPPPHPASVICAAIAAHAKSARRCGREGVIPKLEDPELMLRAPPLRDPLRNVRWFQWDMGALLGADDGADESTSSQAGISW